LCGALRPELAPGLVRDGAVRGTITGPCLPTEPDDGGATLLSGAREIEPTALGDR